MIAQPMTNPGAPARRYTLDAMRGVAAVAVVFTHAEDFLFPLRAASGSLAVDFFFVLSGFVLAQAYEARLREGLAASMFMRLRLARLYPAYALGAALAMIELGARLAIGRSELGPAGLVFAVASLWVMLPSPVPTRFDEVFPLNSVRWSLFFELAINLGFSFGKDLWRRTGTLVATTVVMGILFAVVTFQYRTIELGWNGKTFVAGFVRAGFSFLAGLLVHRLVGGKRLWVTRLAWLPPLALIPLLIAEPPLPVVLLLVLFGFPGLVAVAARWEAPSTRAMSWLGRLSYPLYVIHFPLLNGLRLSLEVTGRSGRSYAPWLGLVVLIGLVGAALIVARWLDGRPRNASRRDAAPTPLQAMR